MSSRAYRRAACSSSAGTPAGIRTTGSRVPCGRSAAMLEVPGGPGGIVRRHVGTLGEDLRRAVGGRPRGSARRAAPSPQETRAMKEAERQRLGLPGPLIRVRTATTCPLMATGRASVSRPGGNSAKDGADACAALSHRTGGAEVRTASPMMPASAIGISCLRRLIEPGTKSDEPPRAQVAAADDEDAHARGFAASAARERVEDLRERARDPSRGSPQRDVRSPQLHRP